jgi:hypothetical protein
MTENAATFNGFDATPRTKWHCDVAAIADQRATEKKNLEDVRLHV